jgi:hypothetical protein
LPQLRLQLAHACLSRLCPLFGFVGALFRFGAGLDFGGSPRFCLGAGLHFGFQGCA